LSNRPNLVDYHVHESHSGDAKKTRVIDIVKAAKARNVNEIAFTTHLVTAGPAEGFGIKENEITEYFDEIYAAQEESEAHLRVGLEVDYFPSEERRLESLLSEYPFDFILGSVHVVNGREIASGKDSASFFEGRPLIEVVSEYFEVWKKAVQSGLFDVMAHPDYFKKHLSLFRSQPLTWRDIKPHALDAIQSLADYGVGYEVNTSCLRHGAGEFFPVKEFVEAAYEIGVKKVTVGSDTHVPQTLGYRISDALSCLHNAGYNKVDLYKGRKSIGVDISSLQATDTTQGSSLETQPPIYYFEELKL
jgi:histidinol-phosphatase (PHP family)